MLKKRISAAMLVTVLAIGAVPLSAAPADRSRVANDPMGALARWGKKIVRILDEVVVPRPDVPPPPPPPTTT